MVLAFLTMTLCLVWLTLECSRIFITLVGLDEGQLLAFPKCTTKGHLHVEFGDANLGLLAGKDFILVLLQEGRAMRWGPG